MRQVDTDKWHPRNHPVQRLIDAGHLLRDYSYDNEKAIATFSTVFLWDTNTQRRQRLEMQMPVTWLACCDICGAHKTKGRPVIGRLDCFGWNRPNFGWDFSRFHKKEYSPSCMEGRSKHLLCVPCWNKVKPLVKKAALYHENRSLINKLKKVITNAKKNQNRG